MWALALFRVIANLVLVHRLSGQRTDDRHQGRFVSIIIPARNEARAIERTVGAFLAQRYEPLEVIVVDDCSTDGTGDIVRAIADPHLIVIAGEEPRPSWLGKPLALEQGGGGAHGELLLFVDADVHYEPDTLRTAVRHIEREPGIAMLTVAALRDAWFLE